MIGKKKNQSDTELNNNVEEDIKNSKEKRKKDKSSEKVLHEKSDLARSLDIRISSPYGYYPEDVDPIIRNLQLTISTYEKENKTLSDELEDTKSKLQKLKSEFNQYRFQMNLAETPVAPAAAEYALLSRIDTITGENSAEQSSQQPQTKPKIKINLKN